MHPTGQTRLGRYVMEGKRFAHMRSLTRTFVCPSVVSARPCWPQKCGQRGAARLQNPVLHSPRQTVI